MTVVAFAGRRIDAESTDSPRFPLSAVETVARRIAATLVSLEATVLVSSAACGADLVALTEAGKLGIRQRVILPVPPETFATQSVSDRPGDWLPAFWQIVATARANGDLVVLNAASGDEGYRVATDAILDEARRLGAAGGCPTVAMIAWDGRPRPGDDPTETFRQHAAAQGLTVHEIRSV